MISDDATGISPPGAAVGEGAGSPGAGEPARCMNCRAVLCGPFCSACGQRDRDLRRPLRAFAAEFADNVFSLDSRLARTLFPLFLRPGRVSRRYVDGQRMRFVPPVRMALVSVLVFFVSLRATDVALIHFRACEDCRTNLVFFVPASRIAPEPVIGEEEIAEFEAEFASEDEEARERLDWTRRLLDGFNRAATQPALVNEIFNEWLPRAMIILVPVMAFLLRGVYWGRQHYLFNQLVFSLHFHAFLFALLTLIVLISATGLDAVAAPIYFMASSVYFLLGMKRFYGQGWVRTIVKFLIVGAVYTFLLISTVLAILILGLVAA